MRDDYPSFKLWYDFTKEMFHRTSLFPRSARYSIALRLENYSLDITSLLTEAIYAKEKINKLRLINSKLEQIRILTRLSFEMKFINEKVYEHFNSKIEIFGKMIGGWQRSLKVG